MISSDFEHSGPALSASGALAQRKPYAAPRVLAVESLEASAALCNPDDDIGEAYGKSFPSPFCTIGWGS